MGSIPSILDIFKIVSSSEYFLQKSSFVKHFASKTKKSKVQNKNITKTKRTSAPKTSKVSNYSATILKFKTNKRWKRSTKKRRKLLKPIKAFRSQIAALNLHHKPSFLIYLRLYLRKNLFKKRSLAKTLSKAKQTEGFTYHGVRSLLVKNAKSTPLHQKLHPRYSGNNFLKFHHHHLLSMADARKLKKRKSVIATLSRNKRYKKSRSKLNLRKFKHRLHLVKSPSLFKALYCFYKKKSILSEPLLGSAHKLRPLSLFKVKQSSTLPLSLNKKLTKKSRFPSSNRKQKVRQFKKTQKFEVRLPSWRSIYQIRKSNQSSYVRLWNNHSRNKKPSFSRALPLYQSHSTASNTFKKKMLGCYQTIAIGGDYLVCLIKNNHTLSTSVAGASQHYLSQSRYISFSNIMYNVQLSNILNNSSKNRNNSRVQATLSLNKSLSYKPSNTLDLVIPQSKSNTLKLLHVWLLEKNFIFSKNVFNNRTVNVLSRVPNYKMNLHSPVSADRFRGNIHGRLSIINLSRLSNQQVPSFLTKLNTFSFLEAFKKNTRIENYTSLISINILKKSEDTSFNFYYVKHKAYKMFLRSALRVKFFSDVRVIKVKKIIKNKRRRKRYAIKRTSRLHRARPLKKFYKSFLAQLTLGKKQNMMRLPVHKQRISRLKFLFRLQSFRKKFSDTKKRTSKELRFIKNLLYSSQTKLRKECKSLTEFKELNFKRKRFLVKTLLPKTTSTNITNNNPFLTQKTKNWIQPIKSARKNSSYDLDLHLAPNVANKYKTIYNNPQLILASLLNITLLKTSILNPSSSSNVFDTPSMQYAFSSNVTNTNTFNNLIPDVSLQKVVSKTVINSFKNNFFQENVISWYHNTMIRFIEDCTGKKTLFQFYPFMSQDVTLDFIVRYKRWLPRMVFYERRLGHRFFLEEAIHIIHLSFYLKDPKIICNWLKAMILRISFWKTRSIFRFLKYLFFNYFQYVFKDIGIKGLKIRLKGKISAAGNSRKRTILYRIGNTSHSTTSLRVLNESTTINTFTGVMGFNVWLFY